LLCGAPTGDIILELKRAKNRTAHYVSASETVAKIERPDLTVETIFTEASDAPGYDIVSKLTALKTVHIVSFGHAYTFPPGAVRAANAPLDYAWVPTLKSRQGDVIGDHTFRSPCLIARHAGVQVALVPNLEFYGRSPLRTIMDFNLPRVAHGAGLAPRLCYAMQDYKPQGHVFYTPSGSAAVLQPGETLRIGFTLLFDIEAGPLAHQQVLRFLWRRYGQNNLTSSIAPQIMSFEEYARLAFENTFDNYKLWREFELSGKKCGGICARIVRPGLNQGSVKLPEDTTPGVVMNYLFTPTMSPRDKLSLIKWNFRGIHSHLWNAMFLNNVRTSFGLMHFARRRQDRNLEERARAMWNLAISAPVRAGIFPSVFVGDGQNPNWAPGTRVWRYATTYHTPDAAVTGWWMLAIDRFLLKDRELFCERCAGLGDFFRRIQLPSGAIPTWIKVNKDSSARAVTALKENASSAAAGWFLTELFRAMGGEEYLNTARRIADFIIERVFPTQAWYDTEVFYSCSPKPLGWTDKSTGILPQGSLCISWTAGLMGNLYECTGEPRYLDYGRAALDALLLFQQIWNAPFLDVDTRGGFASINNDAEWNDARQALFAGLLMDWYGITGEAELFHRGIAALRSAFTLMFLEEHRQVAPGNISPMSAEDRGAFAENYGHSGLNAKIEGYVMPDWGAGTAVAAAALAQLRWGDLYIDAARGNAFGINGCRVINAELQPSLFNLDIERLSDAPLLLRCTDAMDPNIEITINGKSYGIHDRAALGRGIQL
jgi:hypothetical protein